MQQLRQGRIDGVKSASEKWVRICEIRTFIKDARVSMDNYILTEEQREMFTQALNTAEEYVERNHPIQLLYEERYKLQD